MTGPVDVRWQQVRCKDCKRRYQCTPEDDYYGSQGCDDGQCFACLLIANGYDPDTTPVLVVDEDGAELSPAVLADRDAFESGQAGDTAS